MTEPSPDEISEARRWLGEAEDELIVVECCLVTGGRRCEPLRH
jgi:hypothetical protein